MFQLSQSKTTQSLRLWGLTGPADSSNSVTENILSPPAGPIWPALFPASASECISRGVGHDTALWSLQSQDLDTNGNVPSTEPDFASDNFLGSLEHVQPPLDAQSPSVARSGCSPATPKSLNLNRLRVPSLRKIVTQTAEQSLFEFYISDAGPWNRAIEILIPLLSLDDTYAADETLMATAVILRMSEQFSELAEDAQHHLRGAYSLFATACDKWSPACVDMRGASFWTFVRETIRLCFLNEQSFQFNLDKIDGKLPEESDPEEAWANYMSFLLAKLCNTCWGDMDADTKESSRKEIKKSMDEWKSRLPASYSPWYFAREDYKPFPVLKFLSPWHGEAPPPIPSRT
ncbi:unnamed protein product [Clonostachys chloroleuca]|uniref:Uncharacterized protein n=1 Tax=Clonostachys chloroleuca TaxID=1926264 RepID=A0AA35LQS4_9HYPO|nr:unnamed protein product [Clonostachys chloroleuca]